MSIVCDRPSDLYLLESALRSTFSVIATHILAGQVDTVLPEVPEDAGHGHTTMALLLLHLRMLLTRLWWFSRYFNPLNLAWRYYSILAYRCMCGKLSRKQVALLNFEPYPLSPPMTYLQVEAMAEDAYSVKRLEIAGVFSSQGLLSLIAAYQGMLAVQFTLSSSGFGFLPNITKAMAILGLFRVLVSPWVANKVHVEVKDSTPLSPPPHYRCHPAIIHHECGGKQQESCASERRMNKGLAAAWALMLVCLVGLSMRSYLHVPASSFSVPSHLIDRSIEALYNYVSVSALAFHCFFLWSYGAGALANRHPLFDHWLYHVQTLGFLLLLLATLLVGLLDFVHRDFYSKCFF